MRTVPGHTRGMLPLKVKMFPKIPAAVLLCLAVVMGLRFSGTASAALGFVESSAPDPNGTQMPITTVPARMASLNACTDELLLAVADPDQIAGLSRYPIRGMKVIKKAEGTIRSLAGGAEEVLALHPDIVLASDFTRRETLSLLNKHHYRIEAFKVPETFEDIFRDIRRVAALAGRETKGEELVSTLRERLGRRDLSSGGTVPAGNSPRPRVLFFGVAGHVTGAGTFEDSIISEAGGRNLAAEAGIRGHTWISLEELIQLKPDALFLTEDSKANSAGQFLLDHPAIRSAYPDMPIETIPPHLLNCGSPDAVEAVEIVRSVLRRLA